MRSGQVDEAIGKTLKPSLQGAWQQGDRKPEKRAQVDGRVAERFKAPVLKTGVGESLPWVRIPPLPPSFLISLKIYLPLHDSGRLRSIVD